MSKRVFLVSLILAVLIVAIVSGCGRTSTQDLEAIGRATGVKVEFITNDMPVHSNRGYYYDIVRLTDEQGRVSYQLIR